MPGEEKTEEQKEIDEKIEEAGIDPDEFDEDGQPACAKASAGREELAELL